MAPVNNGGGVGGGMCWLLGFSYFLSLFNLGNWNNKSTQLGFN